MNTTTKTAQFTQGPWVVDEDYEDEEQQAIGIVKEGHGYIAGIHILASSNNGEGFTSEDRANATLIAAAPAMYEALETVPLPKHNEAIGEFYTRFYTWYEGQVKQALAQAEGKHD
jgi:hypothetical protein